ncbi:VOC family protein [Roseobacter sp. S98]|uniref:VOC family protein n=1 Tax=Roseobacter algicola (ex Choi et al. 2025) (nom. illeg.) TaxID=3092138 RepID=UPI003F512380
MKTVLPLAASVFLTGATVAAAQDDQAILAMGAYVPTDDMAVSEEFYRTLFDRTPVIELPDFVAFNIEGGWFAIASRIKYAPGSMPGSGAVPYLQSNDLLTLQERASAAGADAPDIIEEPGIHLLKITDPNGQLIEFFALMGQ